jgi:hypothetical protein
MKISVNTEKDIEKVYLDENKDVILEIKKEGENEDGERYGISREPKLMYINKNLQKFIKHEYTDALKDAFYNLKREEFQKLDEATKKELKEYILSLIDQGLYYDVPFVIYVISRFYRKEDFPKEKIEECFNTTIKLFSYYDSDPFEELLEEKEELKQFLGEEGIKLGINEIMEEIKKWLYTGKCFDLRHKLAVNIVLTLFLRLEKISQDFPEYKETIENGLNNIKVYINNEKLNEFIKKALKKEDESNEKKLAKKFIKLFRLKEYLVYLVG